MQMTIKDIQDQAREVAAHFPEATLEQRIMFLMTEVGEVTTEALHLAGAYGTVDPESVKRRLGMEMYDVLWNMCDLANMLGIDLEAAFARKIAANQERMWQEAS